MVSALAALAFPGDGGGDCLIGDSEWRWGNRARLSGVRRLGPAGALAYSSARPARAKCGETHIKV
jgi:hypothetical protein